VPRLRAVTRPLAARFDDADAAGRLIAYLDAQAATAFWRARKAMALELLELEPGMTALDVGCGTGADVRAMAARVAPDGLAIGVDASRALIAEARRRTTTAERAEFRAGDALALPLGDAEVDAIRVERVLQHVPDPAGALAEMARVARPGARLVAIEPDWDTLTVDGDPFEVTLEVCRRWADAIRHPRIGRELGDRLVAAGWRDVEARADTSTIARLPFAQQQFALDELAAQVPDGDRWLEDLRRRDEDGTFAASVTYVTARARAG
jgi:SAM-dependent methyltransferase